jgi:hypothetical protein
MTWPSTYAPGTMGYEIDRIDDELKRNGTISDRIQNAIIDAINIYQRERFRFSETISTTFTTTGGVQNYQIFTDPAYANVVSPQQFFNIDWLTITIPPAVFDMPRIQPEELLILTQTGTQMGQPYVFAFANETIMLYPIPPTGTPGTGPVSQLGTFTAGSNYAPGTYAAVPTTDTTTSGAVGLTFNITVNATGNVSAVQIVSAGVNYNVNDNIVATFSTGSGFSVPVAAVNVNGQGPFLMTVGGHVQYPSPMTATNSGNPAYATGATTTGNRWFTDGEKLIRSRAKYELAINVLRDWTLAEQMSPHAPEFNNGKVGAAWDAYTMMNAEMNRLQSRGLIKPELF